MMIKLGDSPANFYAVDERVWRSAQPSDADFATLAAMGCKTVIDLNNSGSSVVHQSALCIQNKLNYRVFDWSGIIPPTVEKITAALRIVAAASSPILIHCQHGSDRTGTLCACYRIQQGWSFDDAMKEAFFDLGFQGMHEFWMAAAVAEYAESLKK